VVMAPSSSGESKFMFCTVVGDVISSTNFALIRVAQLSLVGVGQLQHLGLKVK